MLTKKMFLIFLFSIKKVVLESSTSSIDLEKFVQIESFLKSTLDNYIEQRESFIKNLESYKLLNFNSQDELNPLNLIEKIRNLNNFSSKLLQLIEDEKLQSENVLKEFSFLKLPNKDDLKLARLAISRLQYTYELDLEDLIKGNIFGVNYKGNLSSEDCLEIGSICIEKGRFKEAENWFRIGLKMVKNDQIHVDLSIKLIDSLIFQRKFGDAWKLIEKFLKNDASNEIVNIHRLMLSEMFKSGLKIDEINNENYLKPFLELCRNSYLPKMFKHLNLKCFYETTNDFSRLARFKIEEFYKNPDIFVIYDILNDEEISKLKGLSYNMLSRSLIAQKNITLKSDFRVSQTAVLTINQDKIISKIMQRVEDMTGLSKTYNERLHMANYGPGGIYYPHFDYLSADDLYVKKLGNRIATVLFYLNDVKYGGATVFPRLKLAVNPKKGMALLWYNSHKNGTVHTGTLHGACPVLLGSKWIATQWIHDFGQEFRRPCSLKNDD